MNKKIISAALAASLAIISATTATAFALNSSKTVAKKTSVAPAETEINNSTEYLSTNHCLELIDYYSTLVSTPTDNN